MTRVTTKRIEEDLAAWADGDLAAPNHDRLKTTLRVAAKGLRRQREALARCRNLLAQVHDEICLLQCDYDNHSPICIGVKREAGNT